MSSEEREILRQYAFWLGIAEEKIEKDSQSSSNVGIDHQLNGCECCNGCHCPP